MRVPKCCKTHSGVSLQPPRIVYTGPLQISSPSPLHRTTHTTEHSKPKTKNRTMPVLAPIATFLGTSTPDARTAPRVTLCSDSIRIVWAVGPRVRLPLASGAAARGGERPFLALPLPIHQRLMAVPCGAAAHHSPCSKYRPSPSTMALITSSMLRGRLGLAGPDGWTASTQDGRRSAQWEHM